VPQRSKKSNVLLGIRILASLGIVGCLAYDYLTHHRNQLASDLGILVAVGLLNVSHLQGRKLAEQNMRRFGLTPDRDEAPPSV